MQKKIRVNHVYLPYFQNKDRYLVLYGSAGSGKSVFAAQKVVARLVGENGHRFLLVRKVANTLRSSVFQLVIDTIRSFDLFDEFSINKSEMRITHTPTGNEILMAGLDDVEKLKSISGVTSVWIEEATELTADDFDQVDLRLRGETENYKQIVLSFNPIDERHWLKGRFFDNELEDATILKTTYRDNEFLDEDYKRTLELKAKVNPNYYRIYVLGLWGREEVTAPFIFNFEKDKHTGKTEIEPYVPLFFSLDFNFDPFVCLMGQQWFANGKHHFRIHKEHILRNRGVTDMIELLRTNYTPAQLANALFTGDATQRRRTIEQNIVNGKNLHAWAQIDQAFRLGKRLRVPNQNPHVVTNRELANTVFSLHPDIMINESCTLLINELMYTSADEQGKVKKSNRQNENERFDAGDALMYSFNTFMNDFIQRFSKYGVS